jgi:hypothetical protein
MWAPMGKLVPQLHEVVTFAYDLCFKHVIAHWKGILDKYTLCRKNMAQLGAQVMENIGEIWYCLVPFLTQGGPSGVLVLVASNRVVFFFNVIPEGIPCRATTNIAYSSMALCSE